MQWKNLFTFGRKPNVPNQESQPLYSNLFNQLFRFFTGTKYKQTIAKPSADTIRHFSNHPVVRHCINLIKDDLLKRKFILKNKRNDDTNDYSIQKAIVMNVLNKPNNTDTYHSLFSAVLDDYVSGDCGVLEVAKSGDMQRPVYLFPVDGYTMQFVLDNPDYKYAQISGNSGIYNYFSNEQIMYLKRNNFTNTPFGMSAVESAYNYINALIGTFEYSRDIASNALPKYMANIKNITPDQLSAYQAYFENDLMGRASLPLVSAEDIESVQISPISEEATFKGYQEFLTAIIAGSFPIPPEKVGVPKSNDRSTIDELNANLQEECLKPYAKPIETMINKIIDIIGYGDMFYFEYVWEETLSQKQSKQTMVIDLFQNDIATVNEIRKMLFLPPIDDEWGNDRITIYKAKVNEKFGINGFGNVKDTSVKEVKK